MNERSVGTLTEQRAAEYLTAKGLRILEMNYRCRIGEIDIIADAPDGTLVFAEVKYRRSELYGLPEEAVGSRKANNIRKVALWYLTERGLTQDSAMRFDVVAMDSREIRWYPNAF